MAAQEESCVKLTQLPPGVTQRQLTLAMRNFARKQEIGSQTIGKIKLAASGEWAEVWLESDIVADRILQCVQNGTPLRIKNQEVTIEKAEGAANSSNTQYLHRPSNENTVKVSVRDVWKSKDYVILCLEEIVDFDLKDDSLLLDCFNSTIFISFKDAEEARQVCAINAEAEEDDGLGKVEMATEADLNFNFDKLWVTGPGLKDLALRRKELENYIKQQIKKPFEILGVIQEEENTAIIVFPETTYQGLAELSWKLRGEFCNGKILTGLVYRSRSVIVRDVPVDNSVLKRYFSSTRRSGGGAIAAIEYNGNDTIITFESEDTLSRVLERTHVLEEHTFRVECYYSCPVSPSSSPDTHSLEQSINIEDKDVLFFKNTKDLENLQTAHHDQIKFTLDHENKQVKIIGNSELTLKRAESEVVTLTLDIKVKKLDVSQERSALMKTESGRHTVLTALESQAMQVIVCFESEPPYFVYKDPTDADAVAEIIIRQVLEKVKPIQDSCACRFLTSRQAEEFLISLNSSGDVKVTFDPVKNSVTFMTFHSKMKTLEESLDKFLRENVMDKTKVLFDAGSLKFAKSCKKTLIDKVCAMATSNGVEVKALSDGFSVCGRKDSLARVEQELIKIRLFIHKEDVNIKYFGVQEFLKSKDGSDKFRDIEVLHHCYLEPHYSTASDEKTRQEPKDCASQSSTIMGDQRTSQSLKESHASSFSFYADSHDMDRYGFADHTEKISELDTIASQTTFKYEFDWIEVNIYQGEITKCEADAIVIACDKSLRLSKGGIGKLVLQFGGQEIQDDLNHKYPQGIDVGDFAVSSGGNLQCSHVYYVSVPNYRGKKEATQLQDVLEDILYNADSRSLSQLALPALGTGNYGFPSNIMAQVYRDAIANYVNTICIRRDLSQIDVVVFPQNPTKTEIIRSLVSAFKDQRVMGNGGDYDDNCSAIASIKSPSNHFRLTQGEITTMNCEAIACTVKDSLDLSGSGTVSKILLKKSGSMLQNELSSKDISQTGIVHTSAPGLPCRNIYFISLDKFDNRWYSGTERLLKQADGDGVHSIALPLFGAGNKSLQQLNGIKENIEQGVEAFYRSRATRLKEIKLVIYDQKTYDFILNERSQHVKQIFRRDSPLKLTVPNPETSIKTDLPKVSTDVKVTIYGNDDGHVKTVSAKVTETFKTCFHEFKVDLDKQLSQQQRTKLDQVAHKKYVQLQYDTNAVKLGSFFQESLHKITKQVYEILRQTDQQSLISVAGSTGSWQYKDGSGTWSDFDKDLCGKLEIGLKGKQKDCILTDARGRKYRVDFTSKPLKEIQLDVNGLAMATFEIRRVDVSGRPTLPKRWDSLHSSENLRLVDVKLGSEEYTDVEDKFRRGGVNSHIKSIQRVENKSLFLQFAAKMKEMESRNGPGFRNEYRLFHGTDTDTVRKITSNGFSRNYRGRNATAFGDGVYFAVNSSYSKGYTSRDQNGDRVMLLARVLVGKSTRSSSGMKALPDQPGTNPPVPYDSGTDGRNQMYIIFHDSQAYPEYIIKF